MNIRFYQSPNEYIPTKLRLKADKVHVDYERIDCPGTVAYEFIVYDKDVDHAKAIINNIVKLIEKQSNKYELPLRHESIDLEGQTNIYNRFIVKFEEKPKSES